MQIIRIALVALIIGTFAGCHTLSRSHDQSAVPTPAPAGNVFGHGGLTQPAGTAVSAAGHTVTRNQLAQIFADRRSKGAMVSVRVVSPTEYAIDFATPSPPIVGTQYRYESFTIRKAELDQALAAEIGHVAIRPSGPGG